ncbi:hypothetical protein D9611_010687 [Ephemerocybe angulata]|uniref:Uncharacterized protein n=1 Tax=Ephemerocybe angulata TaxID=980116 RepID=A0A8H5BBZ2_9AGAR|nr:hypothetical protein D9611_010687 [Tulosesus angulatus]
MSLEFLPLPYTTKITYRLLQITRAWIEREGRRRAGLRIARWVLAIILVLNVKSWPILWHVRLSRPVVRVLLRDFWHRLRVKFSSRAVGHRLEDKWLDTVPLVGMNPFEYQGVYRTRATFDECDYNIHLSNSSYAKVLDISRFEALVQLFPLLFRSGAGMALGASHFHFIREIPAMQKFEIRTTIGSWDRKWLYLVSKFVTQSASTSKPHFQSRDTHPPYSSQCTSEVQYSNNTATPQSPDVSPSPTTSSSSESLFDAIHDPSSSSSSISLPSSPSKSNFFYEPDGSLVHTVVVAKLCFKAGRLSIPPSIVLASNGFNTPTSSRRVTLSSSLDSRPQLALPSHWAKLKRIASPTHGGSIAKLYAFYRGGWRDAQDVNTGSELWWETALGGYVEVHRSAALTDLRGLQEGLECARSL